MTHWINAPHEALLERVAAFITDTANRAVAERGRFTLVLAGGNTPRALHGKLSRGISEERYQELGYTLPGEARRCPGSPEAITLPWSHTLIFLGDERYLPPNHPDSNFGMVRETLISKVCIKPENIHRMPTESGNPEEDARRYETLLMGLFRKRNAATGDAPPPFDLILLGLGDDGHTASLFPDDRAALDERSRWVIAVDAPNGKPPGMRLTMTLPVINEASNVLFLIPSSRHDLARSIFEGERPDLPAGMVRPGHGEVWWFVEDTHSR